MLMCNEAITIYNRYVEARQERWKRTIVKGVSWYGRQEIAVSRDGISSADAVVIRVPMPTPGYVDPEYWTPENGWTIRKKDVILRGVCDTEIAPGETIGKVLKGQNTTVISVSYNTRGGIPHIRIGGA